MARRYREGRVFLRGSRWWYEAWNNGTRIVRSSGSEKRQDAVRALNKLKAEISSGKPVGRDIDRTTFKDLVELLRTDYVANGKRSLRRVEIGLKHLVPFFGDYKARDISSATAEVYKQRRLGEPHTSNASVNRELAALRRALNLGHHHGVVASVPRIAMLREAPARGGFFERAEFDAVRDQLPEYLRPVVTCAFHTGWRIKSELLTRERRHLNLDTGWLRLDPGETKNGEAREFPIGEIPELREVFEQQLARTEAFEKATGRVVPWLFHRDGKAIRDFRAAWEKACAAAGLKRRPHDFRRTAVRNLERSGASRSAAMKAVGHQTESIYRRYAIVDSQALKEAGAKLGTFNANEQANARPKVLPITRASASRP